VDREVQADRIGGVAVHFAHIGGMARRADWADLSRSERDRAWRFAYRENRDRYVIARSRLRRVLAGYLHLAPAKVDIGTAASGKPRLGDRHSEGLQFNLSHSGARCLIGVSSKAAVGVDLEFLGRATPSRGLERYLCQNERLFLSEVRPVDWKRRFYEVWTAKEAYAKASEADLARVLATVPVLEAGAVTPAFKSVVGGAWLLRHIPAPDGYVAALVRGMREEKSR
jgi:4'-phosphopantetheinyl transferase